MPPTSLKSREQLSKDKVLLSAMTYTAPKEKVPTLGIRFSGVNAKVRRIQNKNVKSKTGESFVWRYWQDLDHQLHDI
jgi:hypothetical protein